MADPLIVQEASSVIPSDSSRRGRTGTLIPPAESSIVMQEEVFEEHLNITSQRRRDLLIELGRALGTNEVPASFWACLQVCDIKRLEYILHNAKNSPFFVSCFSDTCRSIPRTWMQRTQETRETSTSTTTSTSSGAQSKRRRVRESAPKKLARERDHGHCVFTKDVPIDVAHIYPNCLIHPSRNLSKSTPEFWKLLSAFWSPQQIQLWQSKIF